VTHLKDLAAITLCLALIGCDQAALMKKWVRPEDESRVRNYVDLLRLGKFDEITRDVDPSLAKPNNRETFAKMAALFPNENPVSTKVVEAHIFHGPEYSTTSMTLEYQFPSKWLLVHLTTKQAGGQTTIIGFHIDALSRSLESQNRFTLVGKSALQYTMLILAVCSLAFSVYAAILCIRTGDGKKKWLWAIVALVGVGSVGINWTTGQLSFTILSIHIPCATAASSLYGPWTVQAFLPLGAILSFSRRRKATPAPESVGGQAQQTRTDITGNP
jgi:hypothetical protein